MALSVIEIKAGTPEFEETERRLTEWGRACRRTAGAMGYPPSSGIARMIEHVKVHERLRKGVRPLKRSKLVKANKDADAKEVSIEIRHADQEPTANGKGTLSMKLSKIEIHASVMQVDKIVNDLEGWMQKTIRRSYLFGQPDWQACQDLRMPKDKYRDQRESAVIRVGELLAVRSGKSL